MLASEPDLQTAISGVLNLKLSSDQKLVEGLVELSKASQNVQNELQLTPRERKKHRPDLLTLMEEQKIASYKKFLGSFKELKEGVDTLHGELTELNGICESMSNNLWKSKQSSRNLIDEIAKLEGERQKLEVERNLAQAYLSAFQLDPEDLKCLRGTESSAPVLSEDFFKVFEKIQKIQSNVSLLMKIGHQTTAVEIMDQMGLFQETALEKIYRWAQSHCKNVENHELSVVLAKSLSYLQIRPMLLKYVLDEYCTHRRSLVVRSFIDALTGVGTLKGIELIGSTDPARYIGDMLAWIHQSLPGEKENLLALLKYCDKIDLDEKVSGCLSNIMDGVSRPLNVRMEQSVLSGLDCAVMNKIDICMQFYVETMEQALPSSNVLITIKELQTLCHQTFLNQLRCQVQAEVGEFRPPGPDLTPSPTIATLLNLLRDLLKDTASSSPEQAHTLINMVITPLLSQINDVSNRLGSPDMGVYLCNCLNTISVFLDEFQNTQVITGGLKGQIETQIDRLSSEQSSWLVAQLGIGHIYTILSEQVDVPLSTIPGMDASSLRIFLNKLDSVTTDPESVLLPQIVHLNDANLKKTVQQQSFKILAIIYKKVFEAVANPKNEYPKDLLNLDPSVLEKNLCGTVAGDSS